MSKITRRTFVGRSLTTAAALTAGARLARAQSPNEKLGAAVVGVKGRGGSHLDAFVRDSRTAVVYVVDVDETIGQNRCEQLADKQGFKPKYVSVLRHAFDDPAVDIDAYFEIWDAMRRRLQDRFGHAVRLEIEPGRYLVAEAGYLLTEIRAVKRSRFSSDPPHLSSRLLVSGDQNWSSRQL